MNRILGAVLAFALVVSWGVGAQTVGPGGGGSGTLTITGDCAGAGTGAFTLACNGTPTPRYVAGKYYLPGGQLTAIAAGGSSGANRIQCTPGDIGAKVTLSGSAIVITTAISGNDQLGIYTDSGGLPGALVGNSASMATGTAGLSVAAMVANVQVGPGTPAGRALWFCHSADNGSTLLPISIAPGLGPSVLGSATATNVLSLTAGIAGILCLGANCAGGSSQPIANGSWPSTLVGTTWSDIAAKNIPAAAVLVNSVP